MGADFIEKTGRSFRKSWDKGRLERATTDLFSRTPECDSPAGVAEVREGMILQEGEPLVIQMTETGLVARRGIVEVAHFITPSNALLRVVEQGCGIGRGRVEAFHELAKVAEISIC
ncbi:hypothetical protein [Sphingomonas sp. OK281]|uniref:hypothetical protein n=1 Tax=Sphingomonas sp. OK281 TaxID=1881067 RepID=UPI0008E3CBE4|nr:hypothetical protein [Sphingomonas sp. OK281]SFO45035.1 hypothetical protein SAMN05428984_4305 [Sphingomonas sp. OK281]